MYTHKHKERGSGGGGMTPLTGFLLILGALWVLWYLGGGPQRAQQEGENPFMTAPTTMEQGQVYNGIGH